MKPYLYLLTSPSRGKDTHKARAGERERECGKKAQVSGGSHCLCLKGPQVYCFTQQYSGQVNLLPHTEATHMTGSRNLQAPNISRNSLHKIKNAVAKYLVSFLDVMPQHQYTPSQCLITSVTESGGLKKALHHLAFVRSRSLVPSFLAHQRALLSSPLLRQKS